MLSWTNTNPSSATKARASRSILPRLTAFVSPASLSSRANVRRSHLSARHAGSKVTVALIWGDGANDRQAIAIPALTTVYKKFPLAFTAQADTADAAFEITGTGSGDFHIGAVSLMPADNVQGFRPDTIALLRQIHSGFWRLPGGNFLSDWSWYDSVGDIDKRPPMFDYAWNAMQTNDVGMDEFMTLCKLIGTEPYITVNAGFGDAHSAAEEVEYMNGSVNTRLGAMRARNGHPEPYHVKFWDIGNEPYGAWQLGRTDLKYYVLKHNEFAKAMRKADPSITLLASGNMPEEMDLTGEMRAKDIGNPKLSKAHPRTGPGAFSSTVGGTSTASPSTGTRSRQALRYRESKESALSMRPPMPATTTSTRPRSNTRVIPPISWPQGRSMGEYQQRFPAMLDKKIFLSIDEYAYFGGGCGWARISSWPLPTACSSTRCFATPIS